MVVMRVFSPEEKARIERFFGDPEFVERCRFYAAGRVGSRRTCGPPETQYAVRYRPTVGGQAVAPRDGPRFGFESRGDAIEAARQFKADARFVLGMVPA